MLRPNTELLTEDVMQGQPRFVDISKGTLTAETKRSKGELKNIQNAIISTIYRQIKENYTLPPAPDLKVLDDITVQLRIYVGPDGTINKTVVKKKSLSKAKDDPTYLPYVEAAQRAIKRLGKFSKLPEEEYNLWKIIDISFTPYQT